MGDTISAAAPSFIGDTINDIFFMKNRLGFLAGENHVLSRAGDFFNFFPATVIDVLDDAPIDAAVSTNEVSILNFTIPFNERMLSFGSKQQFAFHSGNNTMTPKSVVADPTTHFEMEDNCRPVAVGPNIYFVVPLGEYSSVREYFVQPQSLVNDAADVTAHCPNYLPQSIFKLAASTAMDALFALSSLDMNNIYCYRFYWSGDQKAMSSWSKWSYDMDILNIETIDNYLYILASKDGGVTLERMNLKKVFTGDLSFRIHLDRQALLTGVYYADVDSTIWTLPYTDSDDNFIIVDSETGGRVSAVKVGDQLIKPGQYTTPCYIGKSYTFRYRFSEWVYKTGNGQGVQANTSGKIKIRTVTINFSDTGFFSLTVQPFGRIQRTTEYTATVLDVSKSDMPALASGKKRFTVLCNSEGSAIELQNDTYLPSSIYGVNFEGVFTTRSQMI